MKTQIDDLKIEYEVGISGIELVDIRDADGEFVSINIREQQRIIEKLRDEVSPNQT